MSEDCKLMKPLFCDGMFNADCRKMRAVFVREITNGTDTYRLWRRGGKPDLEYPRAENDAYILYVEHDGFLAPLGVTDFNLADLCGFGTTVEKLYGGSEQREKYFSDLRKSANGEDGIVIRALREEEAEIARYGSDPSVQTDYIKAVIDKHVADYRQAESNCGESFPNFIGALFDGKLRKCSELAVVYRRKSDEKRRREAAEIEKEDRRYCEEMNKMAEQTVANAVQTIINGGVLQNDTVEFFRERHDSSSYSVINHLMRMYGVSVPLRTKGWINDKLANITVKDGKCEHLQYLKTKGGRCSQTFFDCVNELIRRVNEGDKA